MLARVKRNKIFEPAWNTRKRYVVMKGSAGSGKSVDTAQFYIVRLLSEPGRNLLCVRKVARSNSVSTFNELRKAARRLGVEKAFTFKLTPPEINCVNGNQVLFAGVNDEGQRDKLRSITPKNGSLTDVWIEEATEITRRDFEIIDDRLRGQLPEGLFYQIRLTFNPVSASHWIKKTFFDYSDGETFTHHSTYLDNVFCDEAYHRRMERRKQIDPEGYRIYGLGEWGEGSGLIFTGYKVEDFDRRDDRFDYIRYGQDFGFNHRNALLDVAFKDDEIYVRREIYLREHTTDGIIAACSWDKNVLMYCDSAEPDRIQMWQNAGYNAVGVKKYPGSVGAGIDWIKQRPLHIHPSCVNTIREISRWRWKKDSNGDYLDEPVPFGDDAMAALRYACSEFVEGSAAIPPALKRPIYNFDSEKQETGERIFVV